MINQKCFFFVYGLLIYLFTYQITTAISCKTNSIQNVRIKKKILPPGVVEYKVPPGVDE